MLFLATMKYLHLLILWSVLVGGIHAQPVTSVSPAPSSVLRLAADTPQVSASGALSLLRTRSREVDPARISSMATWQAVPGNVNLGYTSDVIWLTMTVMLDASAPDQWILGVGNALLDDIQIFYRHADGEWVQMPSGSKIAHSASPLDVRTPSFPLTLPAGETQLLVRLHSKHNLTAEIRLWQRDAFDNHSRRNALYYGLYFGGFLLLMILHGFFWLLNKQNQSGWYLLYLTPIAVIQLLILGIPQWIFQLPQKIADPLLGCSLGAALIIGAKLATSLLDLQSRYPRTSKLFIDASVLPGIASVLLILAGYDEIGLILVQSATLVYLVAAMGLSIYLLCRGYRPARFFVFFFGIYYAAIAVSFLCDLGIFTPNVFTLNVFYWGSLIHMLGMSMRMYFQFTLLRKQVADAKDLAVQTIRKRNEGLEAEVTARTVELQHQIAQRTQLADDLRTALTTERRIREEQRSFVAMVSHEFRTPLAIINVTAQQIARNPGAPWHEVQQRCQNLRDTVHRMMDLVEDYLSVDRMDMQTPVFSPRPCRLSQLIDELIWQWPQGRVSVTLQDVPDVFFCDPGLLKIALQNLLNNADRHAPPGESIGLHAEIVEGNGLQIDVRNGGEPIPLEEVPHLFQKYFRGRMAQQHTGAGLGLYLVKQIADMHGGSVWIENAGQQGKIIFSLFVPGRMATPGVLQ
jgi:two-component system, sensor histidine kinase LadS